MTDTLLTFQQAMDALPDNTSQLIAPEDVRSALLSTTVDRGGAFADDALLPITVPIAAIDVWVDIPSNLVAVTPGVMLQGGVLFWRMDANGHLAYNYVADYPPTTIPPGYGRGVLFTSSISFDPAGSEVYQFAFTVDGVPEEPFISLDAGTQTVDLTASVISGAFLDVTDAPIVSVAVRNTAGTEDVDIVAFVMATRGGIPA